MHNASTLGSTIALDSAHIMPRAKANNLDSTAHSGIQAVGKSSRPCRQSSHSQRAAQSPTLGLCNVVAVRCDRHGIIEAAGVFCHMQQCRDGERQRDKMLTTMTSRPIDDNR